MAGLKPLLIGFLWAGLFALALITGGIMTATNNNANQSIGDNAALLAYQSSLESTLNDAQTNANSSIQAIGDSPISQVSGISFIFDAIGGVWKTLKVVPVTIYNLSVGFLKAQVFGESFNPVFGIVGAIIIMSIIFGVIKLVTSGQDE